MKKLSIEKMKSRFDNCRECNLYRGRKRIVYGDGNFDARFMFVGEAPGREEDAAGIPFVGRAGKLLRAIAFDEIGIEPADVFITNVVMCRPRNNRDPKNIEARACFRRLLNQIYAIKPRAIMTFGRIASNWLINATIEPREMESIGKMIAAANENWDGAQWIAFHRQREVVLKAPVVPNWHPSYLDRQRHNEDLFDAFKRQFQFLGKNNEGNESKKTKS